MCVCFGPARTHSHRSPPFPFLPPFCSYGQFFVLFDWIHGTLTDPLERDPARFGLVEAGAAKAADDGSMFAAAAAAAAKAADVAAASTAKAAMAVAAVSAASEGSAKKRRGSVSAAEGPQAARKAASSSR